jgi:hypothetical protein
MASNNSRVAARMASASLAVATVAPRTPLVDITTSKTKTALPLGRAVNKLNTQSIRLSATNGMLGFSAVKIVVAKKSDRLVGVHVGQDCTGSARMCQAIEFGKVW